MQISKSTFVEVGRQMGLPAEKVEAFWAGLEKLDDSKASLLTKSLYYFGGMVVVAAMLWLLNMGWQMLGGGGTFLIAVAYAILFTALGAIWWRKEALKIPAGILITLAVCMVPVAIYGLTEYWHIWSDDAASVQRFEAMELGTIIAGSIALYFFPFPFLTAPIFLAVCMLTLEFFPALIHFQAWLLLGMGLVMLTLGYIVDRLKKQEYSFWIYLFGTLAFWVGLNWIVWDYGENVRFIYFLVNLAMIGLAIVVRRNVLMIFGAIGVFVYLTHLVYDIFENSILFPFMLTAIGLGIIYAGILLQKHFFNKEK